MLELTAYSTVMSRIVGWSLVLQGCGVSSGVLILTLAGVFDPDVPVLTAAAKGGMMFGIPGLVLVGIGVAIMARWSRRRICLTVDVPAGQVRFRRGRAHDSWLPVWRVEYSRPLWMHVLVLSVKRNGRGESFSCVVSEGQLQTLIPSSGEWPGVVASSLAAAGVPHRVPDVAPGRLAEARSGEQLTLKEYDVVRLVRGMPELDLLPGAAGTVVIVHVDPPGYEVEFCDSDGVTLAVVALTEADIEKVGE